MWMDDGVLTTIAGFLDFNSLARLCFTSKHCLQLLLKDFKTKSYPLTLSTLAAQIIAERLRVPADPFIVERIRHKRIIHFDEASEENVGQSTVFWARIIDDKLIISCFYGFISDGVCNVMGLTEATITPDRSKPMRRGRVLIEQRTYTLDVIGTRTLEYVDGLDLRQVLEWCPLAMPTQAS